MERSVTRPHTMLTVITKMQTLWKLPSCSQQWLLKPILELRLELRLGLRLEFGNARVLIAISSIIDGERYNVGM